MTSSRGTTAPRAAAFASGRRATPAVLLLLGACATGSTFRSGVGDRLLEHPPYYAGAPVADTVRTAHLPVTYQGTFDSPRFDPASGGATPLGRLLAEMNAYLDSLGGTVRLAAGERQPGTPPDVRFGCETDASGECTREGADGALEPGGPTMLLSVGRPSEDWVQWASTTLGQAGAGTALVITLEPAQYWTHQRGLRGTKIVELGTGHTVELPWLTSLDAPVSVLQLTGALVGRDGRAIRIGAEGLLAKRTNIVLSGFGVQAVLSDEDVERVRTLRREDLPGNPLVWQVALRNLVRELTGE